MIGGIMGVTCERPLPTQHPPTSLPGIFSEFFSTRISSFRSDLDATCSMQGLSTRKMGLLFSRVTMTHKVLLFSLSTLSTEEVFALINNEASNKFCTLNPIPTRLLKSALHVFAPVITRIVNLFLSTSSFLSSLKHAIVTPLLKKPSLDREVLGNYRPVSNLSFLSKFIERAVNFPLMGHLDAHDLLPDRQSAYRKHY
jgi:hypothetical protein